MAVIQTPQLPKDVHPEVRKAVNQVTGHLNALLQRIVALESKAAQSSTTVKTTSP